MSLRPGGEQRGLEIHWIEPRVIDPNGRPDLIVESSTSWDGWWLTRVSGRDGRVLKNTSTSDQADPGAINFGKPPHAFEDLDGDGGLDAIVVLPYSTSTSGDQTYVIRDIHSATAGGCGRNRFGSGSTMSRSARCTSVMLTATSGRTSSCWSGSTRTRRMS